MSTTDLQRTIARYGQADLRQAVWQMLNTFIPYLALWVLMVYTVRAGYSYWLTLALIGMASLLLVRIFIFFHDCGHGSFFASRRANTILGYISGVLTFTPYEAWRRSHAQHHATVADLDRRGVGDVWTLTVQEYRAASLRKRIAYRLFRNPVVMFGLGPGAMFLIGQRLPNRKTAKKERNSVLWTNLFILAIVGAASLTIGLRTYLVIQIPVMLVAGAIGIWLFYVQHQFDGVYWARHEDWDMMRASLEGSSYYRLPKVLQWFTGNIGLHHVHHVRPRIPNYHLQRCYDENPALQAVKPLTLRSSLRCVRLKLWDEEQHKMVGFRDAGGPDAR